ncbi:hypothetical protein H8356DRAFT_1423469 [Neocallimastix lanati (nom. inval.)]|nr:hypothetical protein H8356DRAFT_1423469 [Neocallimastix sp. JGI-2020a]
MEIKSTTDSEYLSNEYMKVHCIFNRKVLIVHCDEFKNSYIHFGKCIIQR